MGKLLCDAWSSDGLHSGTPDLSTSMAAIYSAFCCCCCGTSSVHPDTTEVAAMQRSADLISTHNLAVEMTTFKLGLEGGTRGKAPQGHRRQASLGLGGSKMAAPIIRSISGPAQYQSWSAATEGLGLPMRRGSERILHSSRSVGNTSTSMPNGAAWSRSYSGRGNDSQPARTLLEASFRRAARHIRTGQEGSSTADQAVVTSFMAAYAAAAAIQDCKWATANTIAGAFADSAVLVTQDGQTIHGRQAVIARLNQGMELLSKTMDVNSNTKAFGLEATQPESVLGKSHNWLVTTTFKQGLLRFRLKNEFKLTNESKIVELKFTRL